MRSELFDSRKGRHDWGERTICEVHRQLYDAFVLDRMDRIVPLLEEAYILGMKMTKRLVEYKLDLPQWQRNDDPEVKRLRALRIELTEKLNEAGADL